MKFCSLTWGVQTVTNDSADPRGSPNSPHLSPPPNQPFSCGSHPLRCFPACLPCLLSFLGALMSASKPNTGTPSPPRSSGAHPPPLPQALGQSVCAPAFAYTVQLEENHGVADGLLCLVTDLRHCQQDFSCPWPDPFLVLEARFQIHCTQRHPKVQVVAGAQASAGARGPAGSLARCRAELRSRASPTVTWGRSQAPGQARTGRRGRGHPSGDSPAVWGESEGPGFPPSPYVGRIRAKEIVPIETFYS